MKITKVNIGLSKRIYIAMLAIIIISSLAIGIFTITFFKNQNEKYHLDRLQRKEEGVAKGIQYFMKENSIEENLNSVPKLFYTEVEQLSDLNEIGINIYNLKGEILFAFVVDDSKEHEVEPKIDSNVLIELETGNYDVFIEKVSEEHLSTYSYMLNQAGKKIGILNIPYHDFSIQTIEFNSFYRSFLEVYLFLLIGASIIAYFLSRNITRSLRTIGDRMNSVSFDKKNERLSWNSQDEIGQLVMQYNNMIDQLEKSAELLAQSERETAWREMAKQVAHEIKNPLTPMKLSVQFLEQTLKQDSPNFDEKIKKFANNMIIQIEALSNIANEFSSFAKMPSTNLENINLKSIIEVSLETFEKQIKIALQAPEEEIFVEGDKEQLLRVFNNLIKNAIQAIPDEIVGVIIIKITSEENEVLVEIKDNGKGIPADQYDKIFIPNFTTKTSGSGLGLAIVKNIIKNHKGNIWFESEIGRGTKFYIHLPKTDV